MRCRPESFALLLTAVAVGSCSQIHMRHAMNRVQEKYVLLMDGIEARPTFWNARVAARDLRQAFSAKAIVSHPTYSTDPEFQEKLRAVTKALDRFNEFPRDLNQEHLVQLKAGVSQACQSCHYRFRKSR